MHATLLAIHIASGAIGLVLAPLAMLVRFRRVRRLLPRRAAWHPRLGLSYQVVVALVASTAIGLAVLEPENWWLGLIATGTQAAALTGWIVRRRARQGWLPWHIRLMCGSYVSFVTAFLVNIVDSPIAWILPTILGTPLILLAVRRHERPHRVTTPTRSEPEGSEPDAAEVASR